MKTKVLSAILTCVNFLLVQGLNPGDLSKNRVTNSSKRIFYGKPAASSNFPYLVKLDIAGSIGAGGIIADKWILTAAHCVHQHVCSAVIEIFPAVWEPGKSIKPIECYAHPQFAKGLNAYDIGLIKVKDNLLEGGLAKIIPLPSPGTVYPQGTQAVVAGWGQTETSNTPAGLLRADFRVEKWDYCNDKNAEDACRDTPRCVPPTIPRRTLCLQGLGVPNMGVCFGDSGGPAVINGVVAGIVSFGISNKNMCVIGSPSMHVNVVDYLPWIYSFIAPEMDTSGIQVQPEF